MANSRIGQYIIEYLLEGFSSPTRSHRLRLWVDPQGTPAIGAAPATIDIMKKSGATANLQTVADQVWSYFRLAYSNTISASSYSLWRYQTENSKDFISGGVVASPAGSTGTINVAQQMTLTFRHALGGIGKVVMLETNLTGNDRNALVPNPAGTAPQRIAAFLLSADSPMVALDNSFPVAALRDSRGQNEAIFKMVYRAGA